MSVHTYRRKPVTVQAAQWDGTTESADDVLAWIRSNGGTAQLITDEHCTGVSYLAIDTLEGRMLASAGDFVVRGIVGEFHPVRGDIFEQTYENADV